MKHVIPVATLAIASLLTPGCSSVPMLTTSIASVANTFERSEEETKPLKEANPERLAKVCLQTARQLAKRDQYAAAIEQFERAVSFDPSLNVDHEVAVLHGMAGNVNEARMRFEKALSAAPQDGRLRSDYGFFLYSIGEHAPAERELRQALTLVNDPATKSNLACVLASTGRYDEAAALLAEAESNGDPNYSLALLAARAGDQESALLFCEASLAKQPASERAQLLQEQLLASSR